MIGVVGTANVKVYDNKQIKNLDISRDNLKIQIIENKNQCDLYEIKFFIEVQDNSECKSLNDYIGLVRPILEQNTKCFITLVQIFEIRDLGISPLKQIFKK